MLKKTRLLTRPTLARRDAPCPKQGRSERRGESYFVSYVESLSEARTKLADFFSILLVVRERQRGYRPHEKSGWAVSIVGVGGGAFGDLLYPDLSADLSGVA